MANPSSSIASGAEPLPGRLSTALVIVRVAVGIMFAAHGAQKLFGFGLGGVIGFFTQVGIPLPVISAPLVTFVELLGGLALIFGLLTRLSALGLGIEMLGAMLLVHLKNGFFLPQGFEYTFVLLAVLVALGLVGPGVYSVDAAIARRGT
jgi:putative oxidoreductase